MRPKMVLGDRYCMRISGTTDNSYGDNDHQLYSKFKLSSLVINEVICAKQTKQIPCSNEISVFS
jgi:hypothetical protein